MEFDPKRINPDDQRALDLFKARLTHLVSYSAIMTAEEMSKAALELGELELAVLRRMHK